MKMNRWLLFNCLIMIALVMASCTPAVSEEKEEVIPTEETPTTTPILTNENLEVHFIDVGQGDAILVDLGDTEILIDGGDKSPGVVAYLNNYVDGALEVMVATHPHADHIGGLIAVLNTFEVEEIWHNGDTNTSKTYSDFMTAVQSENAEVHVAELHDTIEAGGLSLFVHHPSRTFDSINNNSIVLHLAYGKTDFLFTGDAEKEAEGAMMALSSVRIPEVEILKVGHHGSKTASSKDLLAITSPEIAIYMAKESNSYGHPHEETVQALNEIGADIYGTDIHGTIVIITDGETYTLELEKQAEPLSITESSPPPTSTTTPDTPPEPIPPTTPTVTTNVQITKIFYDGIVPRVESDEYVEVTNLGSEQVDLAGWVLKDIDEGYPSFTFPSYILQPHESIRVYTNENHPEYGGFSFGSGKAVWNNSAPDIAALFDAKGNEISRKSY